MLFYFTTFLYCLSAKALKETHKRNTKGTTGKQAKSSSVAGESSKRKKLSGSSFPPSEAGGMAADGSSSGNGGDLGILVPYFVALPLQGFSKNH